MIHGIAQGLSGNKKKPERKKKNRKVQPKPFPKKIAPWLIEQTGMPAPTFDREVLRERNNQIRERRRQAIADTSAKFHQKS